MPWQQNVSSENSNKNSWVSRQDSDFDEDCELIPEAEKKGGDADEDDAEVQEDDELATKMMTTVIFIMIMIFFRAEKNYDSLTVWKIDQYRGHNSPRQD